MTGLRERWQIQHVLYHFCSLYEVDNTTDLTTSVQPLFKKSGYLPDMCKRFV
jgi:hypothetical protein